MEKSIETIWKEGFLQTDALVAPRINNLYNQKSMHIIDRFRSMFRTNLKAIIGGAIFFLIVSWFMGIFLTGIIFFPILMVVVYINNSLLKGLDKIDKGENSYQYLKAFKGWLSKQIAVNKRLSTFIYPLMFLAVVLGLWFKEIEGSTMGQWLVEALLERFPYTALLLGVPIPVLGFVLAVMGVLAYFGGRIYLWDVNVIYGTLFKKLDELIADIESINA